MKCSIIRDLLPLYCDKLTSAESNEEIENHLRNCAECAEIYENMSREEITVAEQDKNIKPLKKVKKHFLIRLICGILGMAVLLFGVFMFVFWGIIPISSDKLTVDISKENIEGFTFECDENGNEIPDTREKEKSEYIKLLFTGDCSCTRVDTETQNIENGDGTFTSHHTITVYPVIKLPFDDMGEYPNQFEFSISTKNENDTITIHCRNKDMTYYIKDLIEENGLPLE